MLARLRRPPLARFALPFLLVAAPCVVPAPAVCQQTQEVHADSASRARPRFETSDLLYAGALVGSFAAIWPLQDFEESLRPDEPPSGAADVFYSAGATLGSVVVLGGLSAAALGVGAAFDDPGLARLGLHSLEALLVAEIVVQPLKLAVGRRRPIEDDAGSTEFDPFRFDTEYQSFPSGHAAQAFAVASVLDAELGDASPWVPYVAYPVAGLIGASRVVGRKHWLTDVVAGSAVGLFAGHFVERWNHPSADRTRVTVRPVLVASGDGFYAGLDIRLP
jgi:membrane-associated phospholipid phosphatase